MVQDKESAPDPQPDYSPRAQAEGAECPWRGWLMALHVEFLNFLQWLKEYAVGIAWTLAFAVLLFNAGMAYVNLLAVTRNNEHVVLQYEILLELEGVLYSLQEAETGQSEFLITLNEKYLEPYHAGLARLDEQLGHLTNLLSNNPSLLERLQDLKASVTLKRNDMEEVLATLHAKGLDAAREAVRLGRGIQDMDDIQDVVMGMENQERSVLQDKTDQAKQSRTRALLLLISGSIVVLGVSVAVLLLGRRQLIYQRVMEQQLRQANDELEQRVQHRTEALRATNESLREENIERQRLEEQAKRSAEELQRSNKELELFASVASHDLQEPLRKILAFSDRLRTRFADRFDDAAGEYLDRIQFSADQMRQLIEDLLAYARVSIKGRPFVPVDLNKIAREVLNDLEERIRQTGGSVEIDPLPTIEADPLQMRQLIQNLLGNALKFHRADETPLIQIRARPLDPQRNGTPGHIELTISDNGIGFDNEYAVRIFQLFQRLHGQAEYDGSGMGLAICRKIVDRHGGTIKAEGMPGQGAVFTIVLPVIQPSTNGDDSPCLAQ